MFFEGVSPKTATYCSLLGTQVLSVFNIKKWYFSICMCFGCMRMYRPSTACRQKHFNLKDLDICSPTFNHKRAVMEMMLEQERQLCDVLLDQDILPGVGNIIKNEVVIHQVCTLLQTDRTTCWLSDCFYYSTLLCFWANSLCFCDFSEWVQLYMVHFEYQWSGVPTALWVVTWLVPHGITVILLHVLCMLDNHAQVYSVIWIHMCCVRCVDLSFGFIVYNGICRG